ncbi:hypothetical protein CQW23_08457 [Capsicum baccatum]|uniref:Uncharacterized protein n=1 Tax=Capsicum baccatum TaxID=33114 RepID=A0A2G2X923_CAPBA|nr:hypothetical protein CQW23_08457 [Capsicum baccatum]
MTTEAVSYETISGPEVSDEDEDAEDVSKEDSFKEVAVTKKQKSAVGHKENVEVGENENPYGVNELNEHQFENLSTLRLASGVVSS